MSNWKGRRLWYQCRLLARLKIGCFVSKYFYMCPCIFIFSSSFVLSPFTQVLSSCASCHASLAHFMCFIFTLFWDLLLFSRFPGLLQDNIGQWQTVNSRLFPQNGPDRRLCGMFTGKFTHLRETSSILISRVFSLPAPSPTKD